MGALMPPVFKDQSGSSKDSYINLDTFRIQQIRTWTNNEHCKLRNSPVNQTEKKEDDQEQAWRGIHMISE